MRRWVYLLPLAVFGGLLAIFWAGLGRNPAIIPSALIDQPAPAFALPSPLPQGSGLASADLKGRASIVNAFASWCVPCRAEQPMLLALAKRGGAPIYGLDYKDKPDAAAAFLAELGNPFTRIGLDGNGRVGIDWGLTGVPETYLVDREGRIRYKFVGPLTEEVIDRDILPRIAVLNK